MYGHIQARKSGSSVFQLGHKLFPAESADFFHGACDFAQHIIHKLYRSANTLVDGGARGSCLALHLLQVKFHWHTRAHPFVAREDGTLGDDFRQAGLATTTTRGRVRRMSGMSGLKFSRAMLKLPNELLTSVWILPSFFSTCLSNDSSLRGGHGLP